MEKLTSADAIRAEFWRTHPDLSRRRIRDYSGEGRMYTTDTRCAFVDFLQELRDAGRVSSGLAERATLTRQGD